MNPRSPRRIPRGTPQFESLETKALMTHGAAAGALHMLQVQHQAAIVQQHTANALQAHAAQALAHLALPADTTGTGTGTTGSNSNGGGNNLGPATNTYSQYDVNSNYIGGSLGLQAFVDGLYIDVLHRTASSDESAFWVGTLESGRFAPYTVVSYFQESQEAINAGGSGQPVHPGHPPYNIYTGYLGGPVGVTAFVDGLYYDVLHRAPDAAGEAYWVGQVENHDLLPAKITFSFLASAETLQR